MSYDSYAFCLPTKLYSASVGNRIPDEFPNSFTLFHTLASSALPIAFPVRLTHHHCHQCKTKEVAGVQKCQVETSTFDALVLALFQCVVNDIYESVD